MNGTMPCDIKAILDRNCARCHNPNDGDPIYGAPMKMVTYEDVFQPAKTEQVPVWYRMWEKIQDNAKPMPEDRDLHPMSSSDFSTLKAWLESGGQNGPLSGYACGQQPPPGSGGGAAYGGATSYGGAGNGSGGTWGGTGGTMGGGGVTGGGGDGAGGVSIVGAGDSGSKPLDTECNYIDITARADANNTPFPVPAGTSELYQCFSWHVDLGGAKQAFSFSPLIDNTSVIHHWLLYQAAGAETNGASSPCLGFHPDGTLIAGWAPGAGDWNLPPDVGTELTSGDFLLEVHYNNYSGVNATDHSGVRMCAGKVARPNTAGISWLGNDIFGGFGVPGIPPMSTNAPIAGRCRPNLAGPVHILTSWPHMHKRGRHMTAELDLADGTKNVYLDNPFDFNKQWQYSTPLTVNPGDSILTTCFFDNPDATQVSFGEATTNEMCFNFTLAYPAHTLVGGGLHNNSCISAP